MKEAWRLGTNNIRNSLILLCVVSYGEEAGELLCGKNQSRKVCP